MMHRLSGILLFSAPEILYAVRGEKGRERMRVDLIVHAPGAAAQARAALPWLGAAIFGDDAMALTVAVQALASRSCHRLAILDAFGQRPNSPLADQSAPAN